MNNKRLLELAGVTEATDEQRRAVVNATVNNLILKATKLVKAPYRKDKGKVEENLTALIHDVIGELENQGFSVDVKLLGGDHFTN